MNFINPDDLDDSPADELSADMKELEDRAHARRVLLSSDAMRHFLSICKDEVDRLAFLDRIIADARVSYPSEDGWVVLSLSRMHELCKAIMEKKGKPQDGVTVKLVDTPLGAGSLAEALVSGDVNAAYRMVENRPMVALADAAADLDAVYRKLQGQSIDENQVSNLLEETVRALEPRTIEQMLMALTSAVDGTYTDEKAAVKIAIMKAVDIATDNS